MMGSPVSGLNGKIALGVRDSEPDWATYAAPAAT